MLARPVRGVALIVMWSAFPLGLAACSAEPSPENDERVIYCLAAERRQSLIDAAVELGVAKPSQLMPEHLVVGGRDIPVRKWRGPEFERVCDALMAATRDQAPASTDTPGWVTSLVATGQAVVLLLVGAVVTLLTGGLRDAGTRRRLLAAALRTAADAFADTCGAYLDAQSERRFSAAPGQLLRDRRQDLITKLREVRALYRKSVDPEPALTLLTGPLGESMQRDWELEDAADNQQRAAVLRQRLTTLAEELAGITDWLELSPLGRLGGEK